MRRQISKVGVLGVIPKTISMCIESRNITFGNADGEKWVFEAPAIRGLSFLNRFVACSIGKILFKKYIKEQGKPDVVHVHNVQVADLAVWILKKYNIPFIITEHSSLMWQVDPVNVAVVKKIRAYYEQSSVNIAVSRALADHLTATFNLPFIYIPNVVDTEYFDLNITLPHRTDVRLVSIGNLTANKNHLRLVKAVHSLIEQGYQLRLEIAGDGKEKHSLADYITKNGLQHRVKLHGLLSKQQIRALLKQSDFFVLPSRRETFGVVLIEAIASGLPVLAFKSGGPESIITTDVIGVLLDPDDDLAEGLVKLISGKYDPLAIRQFAEENFSCGAIVKQLYNLYAVVTK